MSNKEISTINSYTALEGFNLADALSEEMVGMNITFDRVMIPAAGGTVFEVPGALPGETDTVKEFSGVILFHHPLFSYYKERFTGGNNPPDCGSYDGVTGVGNPGGTCERCPLNQFGSGDNGGKACKNKRRIFILREGEMIPLILTLPTGSMKEFSVYIKRDLKNVTSRVAFGRLSDRRDDLTALGRALLDTALTLSRVTVKQWYNEALPLFKATLPSRILNNLACCMVGLRLLEALCARLGFSWDQVFTINMDACVKYMEYAVQDYLLDGGESNKSVVEQTLEVIDRMGLSDEECRILDDENIAIHFRGVYDRYTQYRRDHAILGECLPYSQFMKQLRKSELYIETRTVRFGDDPKKAVILHYGLLRQRCDIEGFLQTQVKPLGTSGSVTVTM